MYQLWNIVGRGAILMLVLTTTKGAIIYLNHRNIVCMSYKKKITNIEMSNGKTYKVLQYMMDIMKDIRKGDLV